MTPLQVPPGDATGYRRIASVDRVSASTVLLVNGDQTVPDGAPNAAATVWRTSGGYWAVTDGVGDDIATRTRCGAAVNYVLRSWGLDPSDARIERTDER